MLRLEVPCVKVHNVPTSAVTPKPDIRVTGLLFRNVPEAETVPTIVITAYIYRCR
jgi:hypothetical protein